MNVIKLKTKKKNFEMWINLAHVTRLFRDRDLSRDTWDVHIEFGMPDYTEEYDTEKERDERFEDLFLKWSGKAYLKEVK